MKWIELSSPAISQLDTSLPVVVPLGSIEQHGLHLPVGVDTYQVETIAAEVESALHDRIIVLPVLWLGSSDHHRDYAGTVTVAPSLYSRMITSVAESILRAGFRRIFFLNGHGGNETPGMQALTELCSTSDLADDAWLALSSWWNVASGAITSETLGMQQPAIRHACEYETSLMLAIRPELVNQSLNTLEQAGFHGLLWDSPWLAKVRTFQRFHRLTASGSVGMPQHATATKGAALLEAVVAETVRFLEDFRTWPHLPAHEPPSGA